MVEKKIKKKKLTLTISSTKPYNVPNYTQGGQKKSVVIEKKISRKRNERRFFEPNKSAPRFSDKSKQVGKIISKNTEINRNFEIRKIAEERATKRFKSPKEDVLVQKNIKSKKL